MFNLAIFWVIRWAWIKDAESEIEPDKSKSVKNNNR